MAALIGDKMSRTQSKKSLVRDMTVGRESSHIIRFAIPLLFGNILQQLYNLVDTLIVGNYLGDDALAAVGATGSMTFLFNALCFGLSVGAGVVISQYFGAGEIKSVKAAIFNSIIVAICMGIVVGSLAAVLARPILTALNTPDKLIKMSIAYFRVASGFTVFVALYNWINAVMRALGDSKTPLMFLGFSSILNVILDLLFVVVFKWGVAGAAIATVISQGVSAICCIIYCMIRNEVIRLEKEHRVINKQILGKCIKTGVPISLQSSLISISMIALQRVTNGFGEAVMAAYTVSMRIEQLIQQPFISLNAATSAFAGQNIGAGQTDRARRGYRVSLKIGGIFSIAFLLLFMALSKPIVMFFVSGEKTIKIASLGLKITSIFYMFLGMIHITRGFLNGVGDVGYSLINGISEVSCRIIFSLILTNIAFIGYWGIWWTTGITWFITGIVSFMRYKSDVWMGKAIVRRAN